MNKRDFFRYSSKILELDPDDWIYNDKSCDHVTYIGPKPRIKGLSFTGNNLYGPTYLYQTNTGYHILISEKFMDYSIDSSSYNPDWDGEKKDADELVKTLSEYQPDALVLNQCFIPDIIADSSRVSYLDLLSYLRTTNINYAVLVPFFYNNALYKGIAIDNYVSQFTLGVEI